MITKNKIKKTSKMFTPAVLLKLMRKKLLIEPIADNFLPTCHIEQTNDLDFLHVLKIKYGEYKFPFYIRNNTSDVGVYKSIIESIEYNFIPSRTPEVIIDGGANIGLATIYFAAKYPDAKIISIEPEINNFILLRHNTRNYPNVIAIQAALWNEIREIELLDTGLGNWGFMTTGCSNYNNITTPEKQKKYTVKTVTIESLLNEYNLDMIDILKIDIEGAEKEVFQNHSLWINNVNSIIVELHERMKHGCKKEFWKVARKYDEIAKYKEDYYLSKSGFIKMI